MAGPVVIYSRRVVSGGRIGPASVVIDAGRISAILPAAPPPNAPVIDLGNLVLMPGLVDTHVHVNEPGRTEWEGFATAGRAAAAGGVTTLIAMPLNCSPVATTVAALEQEAAAAHETCAVDYGFWGGVIPGNDRDLLPLWDAGVLGFKAFMVHSGIDEFPNVTESDLDRALAILARLPGAAPLLVHAEDPATLARAAGPWLRAGHRRYANYLASRPPASEQAAIDTLIRLAAGHRARVHIVHLSAAAALPAIRDARRRGLPLTLETCPHYLAFAAEDIPDGATLFKCAPPIRDAANRELLWQALRAGDIDLIASDHSPCPPALKQLDTGDFAAAWGGISSLQLTLPIVWTEASRRGFTLPDLARWLCEAPARLAGLDRTKGRIAPGFDADLVAWDPDAPFTVDARALQHRHPITPYQGRTLRGVVRRTLLRGETIFESPAPAAVGAPSTPRFPGTIHGRWLKRQALSPTSPS